MDFGSVYSQHYQRVYSVCLSMLKDPSLAEDLTQDTFIQVFKHLDSFRGDSRISSWLHRIAVNAVLMHLRRQPRVECVGLDEIRSPGVKTQTLLRLTLNQAISQLPPGYRKALILHEVVGLKHEEIGAWLDCSPGTSKSQLVKAKSSVRSHFLGNPPRKYRRKIKPLEVS